MHDWVLHDVMGHGNVRRYFTRGIVMFLPVYIVCILLPGPALVRVAMILMLAIPVAYFQIALRNVYRAHLLRSNGIDPDILKVQRLERERRARENWVRRHGY